MQYLGGLVSVACRESLRALCPRVLVGLPLRFRTARGHPTSTHRISSTVGVPHRPYKVRGLPCIYVDDVVFLRRRAFLLCRPSLSVRAYVLVPPLSPPQPSWLSRLYLDDAPRRRHLSLASFDVPPVDVDRARCAVPFLAVIFDLQHSSSSSSNGVRAADITRGTVLTAG